MVDDPLARQAAAQPDTISVVVDGSGGARPSTTTAFELDQLVDRAVNGLLAAGAKPGERIVWSGPNSLEVLVVLLAARRIGLTAVPLNYRFTGDEMAYVVHDSEATLVVADAEQAVTLDGVRAQCPLVQSWVCFSAATEAPPAPAEWTTWAELVANTANPARPELGNRAASMIYTSGTTGKPKGALRTREDAGLLADLLAELHLIHADGVHLTTGPLYHSGPLAFASMAQALGHRIVILRRFDPRAWLRLVREEHVTNTFSAPTQLKRIVALPDDELAAADLSSMITLIANAAPVPYSLKQELIAKLGDGFLYEVYGSTELGVNTVMRPEDQLRKPGSCGRPYGSVELCVVNAAGERAPTSERGELFVRSTSAIDGYHHSVEQLSTVDIEGGGWRSVGDVAYLDDEGFLHICDRLKDMVISGGMNVYPAEVEAVLHEYPAILDAAVFGVPDDEWGERVHAVVQARAGLEIDLDDLQAFVNERMAGYKRPRSYEIRDSLPRTDSGKLLKRVLREEHWQGRESAV